VKDYNEAWKLLTNPNIEILGELEINDMLIFNYRLIDDIKARPGNTSVAIASFVTSYARLKLYEEMEKIENDSPGSVIYHDTDSIVFVWNPSQHINRQPYKPKVGNFLGEMTDEIIEEFGADSKMTEFATLGPKTYAFKVKKADGTVVTKMKTKGATQTVEACDVLNFGLFKEHATLMIDGTRADPVMVPQQQFRANKFHYVKTLKMDKRFQATSDKRRIIGNSTLPYGFAESIYI
jgi:hypothetical protein